jgi:hypothetical protein
LFQLRRAPRSQRRVAAKAFQTTVQRTFQRSTLCNPLQRSAKRSRREHTSQALRQCFDNKKMHFPLQSLRCVTRENNFCKVTREKGQPTGAAEKPPTSTPLQKLYSTLLRKIIIKRERARTVAAKLRHSSCAKHTRPMMYLTPRRYKNWAK